MSHEIRTPMNGVIGLAELLLGTDLRPDQRPYAEGLRSAGEALLAVINDILDFSKIEAGKLELEDVAFDPRHLAEEAARLVAPNAHAKGLELLAACSPAVPAALTGDPGRLRQILVNLLSNAVKFTERGEVVLRVDSVGAGAGDWCTMQFEVADTGIGIDPADHRQILEAFSQADASTTRRYGGTGLGLAICRELSEAMGGSLSLESQPGQGSRFRVTVPLGRVWDAFEPPRPSPVLAGVPALVVDDNAASRAVLEAQLAAWGMHPEAVADGPSALDRLAGGRFEVVVVDSVMPGMDGLEVAARVQAPVKVLLLTTGPAPDPATAAALGIAAAVAKPVGHHELHDALVGALTTDAPAAPASGRATPASTPPTASYGRILVVEDNTTNQMVAMGLLSRLGYEAEVVSNGRQAVEAVARSRYDAVLMDCNMPIMDGYEATAAIRHLEGDSRHTRIVAMTAGALVGDRERCLAAGMDDYVAKPVKLADLALVLPGAATGTPTPDPTVVDAAQLESLRALDDGDGAFLASLVESFAVSSVQALDALAAAVDAGDTGSLAGHAHSLKGEASTLGAGAVVALCEELESLGAPLDVAVARELLSRVATEIGLVRRALQAELDAARAA